MKVAVGIPTFNRAPHLLDTIEDLRRQQPAADEILVVDQSDWYPDGARERLASLAQTGVIRYFRQDTPNLPMARNRVLRETAAEVVIFIDDDVRLSPGFVGAHVKNFSDDNVWAVCGGITESGIPVRPLSVRTWPKILDYRLFDLGWDYQLEDFGSLKGCNHAVRRTAALHLGGYDEAYTGVALREETDLAFRILQAGGRIVFDPAARLHHLRAPAGGCRVNQWGDWSAGCSALRFAVRHRDLLGRHVWAELWHAYRLGVLNKNTVRRPWQVVSRTFRFVRHVSSLMVA